MKTFNVDFEATTLKMIPIEAENREEAERKAKEMIDDREICFGKQTHDDFYKVRVKDIWEKLSD